MVFWNVISWLHVERMLLLQAPNALMSLAIKMHNVIKEGKYFELSVEAFQILKNIVHCIKENKGLTQSMRTLIFEGGAYASV